MWAVVEGTPVMCQTLLEGGVHTNTANDFGRTAVHQACRVVDREEHLAVLIGWKADLELIDELSHSPLITSLIFQNNACTRLLLEAKVDGEDTRSGFPPLIWAVNEGTLAQVEMLIAYGADLEVRGKFGWTPLFHAASAGYDDKVTALLEGGALTEAKDSHDRTPMMLAAHYSQESTVELLIHAGALGSAYHNPTCPMKVKMAAGETEIAAHDRGIAVENSGIELTLTLDSPMKLLRRDLYGTF